MKPIPTLILAVLAAVVSSPLLAFDLQGHRGARGLMPENTLQVFAKALSIGVTTLELDVGVSQDGIVVVGHDPRLSAALTRGDDGKWFAAPGSVLRALTYARIAAYDVGRIDPNHRYAKRFPTQTPVDDTAMPTLAAVFELAVKARNDAVRFNVETKLHPGQPDLTLAPGPFAAAVVAVLRKAGVADRTALQSFDWRTLRHVQKTAPDIPTVYLTAQQRWLDNIAKGKPGPSPWTPGLDVDDHGGSVPRLVKAAGGAVWSPFHREVDKAQVDEAHSLGLQVVVWTVNDAPTMEALIDIGVDGIISDYPDRLRQVMAKRGMALPPATPVEP
jgi:glycerophosphoryl diester phosphodiesterase